MRSATDDSSRRHRESSRCRLRGCALLSSNDGLIRALSFFPCARPWFSGREVAIGGLPRSPAAARSTSGRTGDAVRLDRNVLSDPSTWSLLFKRIIVQDAVQRGGQYFVHLFPGRSLRGNTGRNHQAPRDQNVGIGTFVAVQKGRQNNAIRRWFRHLLECPGRKWSVSALRRRQRHKPQPDRDC